MLASMPWSLAEALLLPPGSALLLLLLGTALRGRKPRAGRAVQLGGFLWLLSTSTPCFAALLLRSLQTSPPLPAEGALPAAQAIVVLSAESDVHGIEYGSAVAGPMTMQRLRYGAALHRRTGLPLLVSGGAPAAGRPSLAAMMATAAKDEFHVPVRWIEERSANTRENAQFSAELLRRDGIHTILLVTSAWHMPRAAAWFRAQGLDVVPAPTAFRGPAFEDWTSFVPRVTALRDTCHALHEIGGLVAYGIGL